MLAALTAVIVRVETFLALPSNLAKRAELETHADGAIVGLRLDVWSDEYAGQHPWSEAERSRDPLLADLMSDLEVVNDHYAFNQGPKSPNANALASAVINLGAVVTELLTGSPGAELEADLHEGCAYLRVKKPQQGRPAPPSTRKPTTSEPTISAAHRSLAMSQLELFEFLGDARAELQAMERDVNGLEAGLGDLREVKHRMNELEKLFWNLDCALREGAEELTGEPQGLSTETHVRNLAWLIAVTDPPDLIAFSRTELVARASRAFTRPEGRRPID